MIKQYDKVYQELITNRYLLTTILTNLFALIEGIRERDKELAKILPDYRRKKLDKIFDNIQSIKFEYFSITPAQYDSLRNTYSDDVVAESAKILDSRIKTTGKRYRSYYKQLRTLCKKVYNIKQEKHKIAIRNNKLKETDYTTIDNKTTAIDYLKLLPPHTRNLSTEYKYLTDKFNIREDELL